MNVMCAAYLSTSIWLTRVSLLQEPLLSLDNVISPIRFGSSLTLSCPFYFLSLLLPVIKSFFTILITIICSVALVYFDFVAGNL
jgi:hypothetical protein